MDKLQWMVVKDKSSSSASRPSGVNSLSPIYFKFRVEIESTQFYILYYHLDSKCNITEIIMRESNRALPT